MVLNEAVMIGVCAGYAVLAVLLVACSSARKPTIEPPPTAEAPPPPSATAPPPSANQHVAPEPAASATALPELPVGQSALLRRRERELREVIEQNMRDKRFNHGVNGDTIGALQRAVTREDLPVLERILEGDDLVHARAAAEVLLRMAPDGHALLRQSAERVKGRPGSELLLRDYLSQLDRITAAPKSVEELLEPCHRGDAHVCWLGARGFERGNIGPVDLPTALKYYQLACQAGHPRGCQDAARLQSKVKSK